MDKLSLLTYYLTNHILRQQESTNKANIRFKVFTRHQDNLIRVIQSTLLCKAIPNIRNYQDKLDKIIPRLTSFSRVPVGGQLYMAPTPKQTSSEVHYQQQLIQPDAYTYQPILQAQQQYASSTNVPSGKNPMLLLSATISPTTYLPNLCSSFSLDKYTEITLASYHWLYGTGITLNALTGSPTKYHTYI